MLFAQSCHSFYQGKKIHKAISRIRIKTDGEKAQCPASSSKNIHCQSIVQWLEPQRGKEIDSRGKWKRKVKKKTQQNAGLLSSLGSWWFFTPPFFRYLLNTYCEPCTVTGTRKAMVKKPAVLFALRSLSGRIWDFSEPGWGEEQWKHSQSGEDGLNIYDSF